MLYTIAVVLLILWVLGLVSSYTLGGLIHILLVVAIVVILAAAFLNSRGWSQRAGLFPWVVLAPTLLLAVWQLVDDVRGKTTPPTVVIGHSAKIDTPLPVIVAHRKRTAEVDARVAESIPASHGEMT